MNNDIAESYVIIAIKFNENTFALQMPFHLKSISNPQFETVVLLSVSAVPQSMFYYRFVKDTSSKSIDC